MMPLKMTVNTVPYHIRDQSRGLLGSFRNYSCAFVLLVVPSYSSSRVTFEQPMEVPCLHSKKPADIPTLGSFTPSLSDCISILPSNWDKSDLSLDSCRSLYNSTAIFKDLQPGTSHGEIPQRTTIITWTIYSQVRLCFLTHLQLFCARHQINSGPSLSPT